MLPIQLFIYNMLGCRVSVFLLLFLYVEAQPYQVNKPGLRDATWTHWYFSWLELCFPVSVPILHLLVPQICSFHPIPSTRKEKDHFIQMNQYTPYSETATAAKHTSTSSLWIWSILFYIFKYRDEKTHTGRMQAFKGLIQCINISALHELPQKHYLTEKWHLQSTCNSLCHINEPRQQQQKKIIRKEDFQGKHCFTADYNYLRGFRLNRCPQLAISIEINHSSHQPSASCNLTQRNSVLHFCCARSVQAVVHNWHSWEVCWP